MKMMPATTADGTSETRSSIPQSAAIGSENGGAAIGRSGGDGGDGRRRRRLAAADGTTDGTTGSVSVPYLYNDGQASHPVEEYKPDESEANDRGEVAQTITPSFVLDVTWPRVAVFYHPASAVCQDLTAKYVTLARSVRHASSRVPVAFHAVSCQVHPDVCEEFDVRAVPVVLAFKAGRIDGSVLRRNEDNTIDVSYLADVLELNLGPVVEGGGGDEEEESSAVAGRGAAGPTSTEQRGGGGGGGRGQIQTGRQYQSPHHAAAAAAAAAVAAADIDGADNNSESSAVFSDAAASLIAAMEQTVYDPDGPPDSPLSRELAQILREFLDLLHWSLPSQWKLHDLINDLRTDYDAVIKGRDELLRVLYRHRSPGDRLFWSPACSSGKYVDAHEAGGLDVVPDFAGYTCGLFRLFHISAAGVARQHGSVYGDRDKVRPSHVAAVLRDYVESYYGGSSRTFRRVFLNAVDECRFDLCGGRLADVRPDSKPSDEGWTDLSLWLWNVHNEVRSSLGGGGGRGGVGSSEEPWPSPGKCPNCHGTLGGWDYDVVYDYLDGRYWPPGVQNPRIVVLKPWGGRKRARLGGRLRSAASGVVSRGAVPLAFVAALAMGIGWLRVKWSNHISGWHKKQNQTGYSVGQERSPGAVKRGPRRRYGASLAGGRSMHSFLDR